MKINNEDRIKLFAEKANVFFIPDDVMVLEFISNGNKVKQLKIRQGLATKVADRKE